MIGGALRRKYFSESWLLWVALAIGTSIFCWVRVHVVGEFDKSQFRQIIDLLPKDWRKFATVDFDWLGSYLGRTALTLDEPMLLLLVTSWVMVRGSDVVSGEVSRGTMEMLCSQPVSRNRIWWTHAAWTVLGLIGLVAITWLSMAIGIWTTNVKETTYATMWLGVVEVPMTFTEPKVETIAMSDRVNPMLFAPGLVNLLTFGILLGGFSAWCSSWDRFRWRTLGVVAGFYFLQGGMKIIALASETLSWVRYGTVFGFYSPASSIESTSKDAWSCLALLRESSKGEMLPGPVLNNLVLLLLGVGLYWWGSRVFSKRDLPAPI